MSIKHNKIAKSKDLINMVRSTIKIGTPIKPAKHKNILDLGDKTLAELMEEQDNQISSLNKNKEEAKNINKSHLADKEDDKTRGSKSVRKVLAKKFKWFCTIF
jgi:hypothetical protein